MPASIVAIVPARDEADRVSDTLDALQTIEGVTRLIVVDDGSRDHTAALARSGGAEVLKAAPSGRPGGKGRALIAGLSQARRHEPEVVLLADADLGPSASQLGLLAGALDERRPASIAVFPPATGGGFGLVKRFARWEISRRTGFTPTEPLSGQRALHADALNTLPGIAPGFGAEVGMTLDLLAAGIEPFEVPILLEHRPTGRNVPGFVHRTRQGLDILHALGGTRIPW
ncbi:MAG: glycosyltransferase [Rubrobacteraceae bacterium]